MSTAATSIPVTQDLDARLARITADIEGLDTHAMLAHMLEKEFPGQIALTSSFGAESSVLLALLSEVDRNVPVVFLDTQKLFGETLRYRDQLQKILGLTNIITVEPDPNEALAEDPKGILWASDADACCNLRKVRPLARIMENYQASITGRKRFQSDTRAHVPLIERAGDKFKVNPLADWSPERLAEFMKKYDLPPHPLVADGYLSIGCMPCTRPVKPGEDARAGRWAGLEKTECGIHVQG